MREFLLLFSVPKPFAVFLLCAWAVLVVAVNVPLPFLEITLSEEPFEVPEVLAGLIFVPILLFSAPIMLAMLPFALLGIDVLNMVIAASYPFLWLAFLLRKFKIFPAPLSWTALVISSVAAIIFIVPSIQDLRDSTDGQTGIAIMFIYSAGTLIAIAIMLVFSVIFRKIYKGR